MIRVIFTYLLACLSGILFLAPFFANAQSASQVQSVMLEAEVSKDPATIKLKWGTNPNATDYDVLRKQFGAGSWDSLTQNSSQDTTFTDQSVQVGAHYQYRVVKEKNDTAIGSGNINSGIEVPARHFRGHLGLLIESSLKDSLSDALHQLKMDLYGSGWSVHPMYIDTSLSVVSVRDSIKKLQQEYPNDFNTVFLFGEVPVPYSGNFAGSQFIPRPPDGHKDKHSGAWPADLYYGELDGNWTDNRAMDTGSNYPRNHNVPGDNKFDQSILPQYPGFPMQVASKIELRVGRVDFSNMPIFSESQYELLRRYIKKNHAYRHGEVTIKRQGVLEDNFNLPEGFAQNGYRNFAPLLGRKNVKDGDYSGALNNGNYLWSYGAGAGADNFRSASGIVSSSDFVSDSFHSVFSLLFGSYFGDWDSQDNLMRAALASKGNILASAWAGRPHWHFAPMGLGASIGYCAKITQNNARIRNNNPLYWQGAYAGGTHVALMGDPTLTMYNFPGPKGIDHNVLRSTDGKTDGVRLTWEASAKADGYVVYRWDTSKERYAKINKNLVTDTNFKDFQIEMDTHAYMVRAKRLQSTPSGSYYNLSQGVFDTAKNLDPSSGRKMADQRQNMEVFPNPSNGEVNVQLEHSEKSGDQYLKVVSLSGVEVKKIDIVPSQKDFNLDLKALKPGAYFIEWHNGQTVNTEKVVINQ